MFCHYVLRSFFSIMFLSLCFCLKDQKNFLKNLWPPTFAIFEKHHNKGKNYFKMFVDWFWILAIQFLKFQICDAAIKKHNDRTLKHNSAGQFTESIM